jgi:DNA recombination protein RmuC
MELLAVSLTLLVVVFIAYRLYQKVENGNSALVQTNQLLQEKTILLATTEKELVMLIEKLDYERQKRNEDETMLREQIAAISKNIVHQGNQVIKQENQFQLEQLLLPFKEKLTTFENEIRAQKERGIAQFSSMESLVKALSEQHQLMNHTAQNLADALKGDQKTQGNWGELALERILEISGLQEGIEYEKQHTLKGENDKQLRPDFLIKLPDNKHIIVDSKVSLTAFERYINANDDLEKSTALKAHLLSIHTHIKTLSDKDYARSKDIHTPEFVLLFLPIESAFSLAIKGEPELYARAWEKRIVIVTPSTLLATLKTIESIWKQERQTINTLRIASEAGKLYDKFVGFIDDMKTIEKKQKEALGATDAAMKKLHVGSGNLVGKIENLKKLGAKATKQIDRNELAANELYEDADEAISENEKND